MIPVTIRTFHTQISDSGGFGSAKRYSNATHFQSHTITHNIESSVNRMRTPLHRKTRSSQSILNARVFETCTGYWRHCKAQGDRTFPCAWVTHNNRRNHPPGTFTYNYLTLAHAHIAIETHATRHAFWRSMPILRNRPAYSKLLSLHPNTRHWRNGAKRSTVPLCLRHLLLQHRQLVLNI